MATSKKKTNSEMKKDDLNYNKDLLIDGIHMDRDGYIQLCTIFYATYTN